MSSTGVLLFLIVQKDGQCFHHAFCRAWYLIPHIMLIPMVQPFLETTAHALAATLGFLGLYENIQEEVHQQIISIIGHDRDPVLSIIWKCVFNPNHFELTGLR